MFSICKSEWTKSSSYLLDLEPLKHSIAEHMMAKDTLALIQERVSNNNILQQFFFVDKKNVHRVYILIFHILESVNSLFFFFKSMNKVLFYFFFLSNNNNFNNNNNNNNNKNNTLEALLASTLVSDQL